MDADAQGQASASIGLLNDARRRHCLHGTGELDQEAVTDTLERWPECLASAAISGGTATC